MGQILSILTTTKEVPASPVSINGPASVNTVVCEICKMNSSKMWTACSICANKVTYPIEFSS